MTLLLTQNVQPYFVIEHRPVCMITHKHIRLSNSASNLRCTRKAITYNFWHDLPNNY